MSAEAFTGNVLNGFNAAITSPAAINIAILAVEVGALIYFGRKALKGIGVLD